MCWGDWKLPWKALWLLLVCRRLGECVLGLGAVLQRPQLIIPGSSRRATEISSRGWGDCGWSFRGPAGAYRGWGTEYLPEEEGV